METTNIYALVDPRNDTVRYIGKTGDLRKRMWEHKCAKKPRVYKEWISFLLEENTLPKIELLDWVPKNEWEFWERHYISLYKSWGFDLLNLLDGGNQSQVDKNKMKKILAVSARKAVETNRRIGTYEKFRQRMLGDANPSKKTRKPVCQYSLDGALIKEWESCADAARAFGWSRSYINESANKKRKTAYGCYWEFKSQLVN